MKNLYLALALLSFSANAQYYSLFPNPNDSLSFADASGMISHVNLDSVVSTSAKTSYYPFGEFVQLPNTNCSGRINFDGWLGRKIIDSAGYWTFINQGYRLSFNPSILNLIPDSAGFLKRWNRHYELQVRYDSTAYQLLSNTQHDSVRYFTLLAADSTGYKPTDPASPEILQIAVARTRGLQMFPYLPDHREEFAYSTNQTRVETETLTRGDIYDFQVGDELHFSEAATNYAMGTPRGLYARHFRKLLLDRKDFPGQDSVFYTWQETWSYFDPVAPGVIDTTFGIDTLTEGYDSLSHVFAPRLSFDAENRYPTSQWRSAMGPEYFIMDEDMRNGRPGLGLKYHGFEYDSAGCFYAFEPDFFEDYFARGLGKVEAERWRGGYATEYNLDLMYYKKGNETSGTPLQDVGIKEFEQPKLKVYPNPVKSCFKIVLPPSLRSLNLGLISQTGQELRSFKLTQQKTEINLETLPAGVYFLRFDSGEIKIIKM